MLKNYIKIAWRNLTRKKTYSLINILGLSVGLTCSLIVFLYVQNELSYDEFHTNKERLYRVAKVQESGGNVRKSVWSQVPMGPAIKQEYPQVEHAIRFWDAFQPIVSNSQDVYNEDGQLMFTDPAVFKAFSFGLIKGNPETVLENPGSVVLSETAAQKYFGTQNPIGKTLNYRGYPAGNLTLTVTGVMKDLPQNSQFNFNILVTMKGVKTEASNWGSSKPLWTYLLLDKGADRTSLENQLPTFLDSHTDSESTTTKVALEPLTSVHLNSDYEGGFKAGSSMTYLYLFSIIGGMILVIACINFMNLATARSISRATEVGVRKTFGAYRRQLIKQFIGEALLLVSVAQLLALFIAELVLPIFNALAGNSLSIASINPFLLAGVMIVLVVAVGLGAGLYPAFILSGFKPITVLRNRSVSIEKTSGIRKALVVFQFAVSIALIIATGVVIKQMHYVQNKRLGFDKDHIVVLPYSKNEKPLLNQLRQNSDITAISVSQRVPVNRINSDGRIMETPGQKEPVRVESFIIDDHFLDTYDMKLINGRGLSEQAASDSSAFLINETAVKRLGWATSEDALGQPVTWSGTKKGTIVGVVKDFNMASLHQPIEPAVLQLMPDNQWWKTFISIKLRSDADLSETLKFLESTWKKFTPQGAYNYFFIDESLAKLHRADLRLATIFKYVSVLAIFIACLGLLGLVSFMTAQRKREIAIRKVLGATVTNILMLFNKEFLWLVLMGFAIAVPCTVYVMSGWLNDFAYHVNIGASVIILAGLVALVIAGLAVSVQSLKAALANPVDSLRSE